MRSAFINELTELAETNPKIFLIVGDLGYNVVEPFANRHPDRFLNAGVAEQNMTGVAAGLAMCGFHVFTYSIANFPTLRCLEQIRNDVCYHKLPVTIVSVGCGFSYGNLGYSHHAVQDLACMRCMPKMAIATPSDILETRAVIRKICSAPGPSYLRLGKSEEGKLHDTMFEIDSTGLQAIQVVIGATKAVLACGTIANLARIPAGASEASLFNAVYWGSSTSSPQSLINFIEKYERVVIVEEHLRAGGFGSYVRECLEKRPDLQSRIRCLNIGDEATELVGSQDWLRKLTGLTEQAILSSLAISS
jgi:transketolase